MPTECVGKVRDERGEGEGEGKREGRGGGACFFVTLSLSIPAGPTILSKMFFPT